MFSPDDDLYYIYFKEKNSDFRSTRQSKATLFGVSGIDDLQRGFRLNEDILNFYTFFGFSQSIRLNSAINSLKSQSEHVDISSIQKLELNDDSSEDESSNNNDDDDMFEDDVDKLTLYSEDILSHVKRVKKVSPNEKIRFSS